jgi:hypothetical protein
MKPIPGAVAAKASFVDSNGHADRDFVFTRGREMDINETAVAEELNKMKSRIVTRDRLVAATCAQSVAGHREGKAEM